VRAASGRSDAGEEKAARAGAMRGVEVSGPFVGVYIARRGRRRVGAAGGRARRTVDPAQGGW
jgi:hypothetical protein